MQYASVSGELLCDGILPGPTTISARRRRRSHRFRASMNQTFFQPDHPAPRRARCSGIGHAESALTGGSRHRGAGRAPARRKTADASAALDAAWMIARVLRASGPVYRCPAADSRRQRSAAIGLRRCAPSSRLPRPPDGTSRRIGSFRNLPGAAADVPTSSAGTTDGDVGA